MALANAELWCPAASLQFRQFIAGVQHDITDPRGSALPRLMVLEGACFAASRPNVFGTVRLQADFEIAERLPGFPDKMPLGDQAVERVMRHLAGRPIFMEHLEGVRADGKAFVSINDFTAMLFGFFLSFDSYSDKTSTIVADLAANGISVYPFNVYTIEFLLNQLIERPQKFAALRDLRPLLHVGAIKTEALSLVKSLIEAAFRQYLLYLQNVAEKCCLRTA